jgi:hypothetical protein
MTPIEGELTAENVLKLLNNGLSDRNLIKRLFDDQMYSVSQCGSDYLELNTKDNVNFNLVTSENWINNDDIISSEFEAVLEEIDEED